LRNHRLTQPLPGYLTQTMLARRTLFDTVGQFNTALRQAYDVEWFLRVAEQGTVIELLSKVLVYRRLHETNVSVEASTGGLTLPSRAGLLQAVKLSLDRRRHQHEGGPTPLQLPTSDWRKKGS